MRGVGFLPVGRGALDEDMDMPRMVQHAFHIYDNLGEGELGAVDDDDNGVDGEEIPHARDAAAAAAGANEEGDRNVDGIQDEAPPEDHRGDDLLDDDLQGMGDVEPTEMEILEESARTPLYAGAGLTSLSATLLLLTCLRTHNASNMLINELFGLLQKSMLPSINSLPKSEYAASKILKQLGLAYETIHVCHGPKTCMLFRGEGNENLRRCSVCGAERYKTVGKSSVPVKVLRWFPLIPRLERIFSTPLQAWFMTWHRRNRSEDGSMRQAADSPQWKALDDYDPDFAREDRNVRLGLATDGVNPFSIKRSTWSTWPVILSNYNVAPWMTTKKHWTILSLIIPGRASVTGDNFNTYLSPLVEELNTLWNEGIRVQDAAQYNGESSFTLRAGLLWTIHDFPAYGIVAGCVTKGYRACPICGPNTISRRSRALKKNLFNNQARRFLPPGHRDRTSNVDDFDGRPELRPRPPPVTSEQVIRWGTLRQGWLQRGGTPKCDDPARTYGLKRVSALFQLPYWKVLPYRGSFIIYSPNSPLYVFLGLCMSFQSRFTIKLIHFNGVIFMGVYSAYICKDRRRPR